MGSRYLTDLAEVCRSTGRIVHLEAGWETRARSSGGYSSGLPSHVMTHHTASGTASDGQADVNFCCYSADAKPIANLYLSRRAEIWVMAAGATNTNGSGSDSWGGGVPDDSMNSSAIGIEAANSGTGEVWADGQQRAYCELVGALCEAYSIPVNNVRQHSEWAPGRKVDPAGPSRWADGAATWNGAAFRDDIAAGWPGGGGTPLPMGDEPVDYLRLYRNATQYSLFVRSGCMCVNVTNAEQASDLASRGEPVPIHSTSDAAVLKSLVLYGDPPVWYDGSLWPPVSAFACHIP